MEFVFQIIAICGREEERENLLIFLLLGRLTNFLQNAKLRVDKQCNICPPL